MAELRSSPEISFKINLVMSESEARALEAIADYGVDAFIEAFEERLPPSYMKHHKDGLTELFKSIANEIPKHLSKVDKARKVFIED